MESNSFAIYSSQKDTTGMIGALTLMGISAIKAQPKESSQYRYGQKYLLDADTLSQKIKNLEAEIMDTITCLRYYGIDFFSKTIASEVLQKNQRVNTPSSGRKKPSISVQIDILSPNQMFKTINKIMPLKFLYSLPKSLKYLISAYEINGEEIKEEIDSLKIDSLIKSGTIKF